MLSLPQKQEIRGRGEGSKKRLGWVMYRSLAPLALALLGLLSAQAQAAFIFRLPNDAVTPAGPAPTPVSAPAATAPAPAATAPAPTATAPAPAATAPAPAATAPAPAATAPAPAATAPAPTATAPAPTATAPAPTESVPAPTESVPTPPTSSELLTITPALTETPPEPELLPSADVGDIDLLTSSFLDISTAPITWSASDLDYRYSTDYCSDTMCSTASATEIAVNDVPEPTALVLFGISLAALGFSLRRPRRD